ncbi:MAG: gamma-glutamyltransferase family protein [Candidatus Eisenbacteria bacterium]|nr:gamma-glutamyltransferase family protein [Candidatus Eisenbacteria bacterium]
MPIHTSTPEEALPFYARRSVARASEGMVACSQPLAAVEGLRALREGGNAADAIVTMAAMLCVVEPMSTGIGGDAFAIHWSAADRKLRALNASGRAGSKATAAALRAQGLDRVPLTGGRSISVPGAVSGWAALLEKCGTWKLDRCLAPAMETAERGFPVTELIAASWEKLTEKLRANPEAARVYLPGGRAPRAGEVFRNPDLAASLKRIAKGGAKAFYHGVMAEAIAAECAKQGGFVEAEDLAGHKPEWVTPLWAPYRGHYVVECPPNGQGLAALLALRVCEGFDLRGMGALSQAALHVEIEAMRLAFADAHRFIGDPAMAAVPVAELVSETYSATRRALIQPEQALKMPTAGIPRGDNTVYLCAVDGRRDCVSFIQSLYYGFGSGVVVPGTGMALQNRGAGFTLEPGHPNELAPGKRPFHTIIPAMLFDAPPDATDSPGPLAVFGVMGGPMQPQGHLQVVTGMLDFDLDVQRVLELPRFRVEEGRVLLESLVPGTSADALRAFGHRVEHDDTLMGGFGGGQIIRMRRDNGTLEGGSDPRKDGLAIGY